ncbi:MAG: DUF2207 domain-containing protein [Acidobacteriota bacterium]|nr:DUF2207 domain-containing protein [Acidobacteriota bacterium]
MFSHRRLGPVGPTPRSPRWLVALLLTLALVPGMALVPGVALADGYSIDRVDIDATIRTDGSVAVREAREFDFDGSFRGVYWEIPSGSYEGRQIETTIASVGEMVDGSYVPFVEDYSGSNHTYQLSDYGGGVRVKLYSAHADEAVTFVIEYADSNLATRYDDVSVLYWKFVSDGWDVESQNVTCVVHLPVPEGGRVEPEENVRAWGHGPLDASLRFDGEDVIYEVPGVGTSEFAEARITFPAGWLSESTSVGGSRLQEILAEERAWADEANARRTRARWLVYGGAAVGLLGMLATIAGSLSVLARYRRQHKPSFDDTYFRDVPSDDHPAVLGALHRGGSPAGEDFTATLMRLTDLGAVKLELVTVRSKGLLGRTKTEQDHRLTIAADEADRHLDDLDRRALRTLDAIGRHVKRQQEDDPTAKIVYFSQIERIAKEHPERFHDALEGWNGAVEGEVARRQFLRSDRPTGRAAAAGLAFLSVVLIVGSVLLMAATEAWQLYLPLLLGHLVSFVVAATVAARCKSVSDEAIEIRAKLVALRRWLKDFTRLEEAVPRDVVLWNRLLVMAVVLGVADEVIEQLKVAMPEVLQDPALAPAHAWCYVGPRGRPYDSFNATYATAHSVSEARLAASQMSSGGGGGGGFSGGGGGGGGGFGGGGGGGAF